MTNAINAAGEVVSHNSNNTEDNELRFTSRDVDAEAIAKGHLQKVSTYIPDEEANNNISIVKRHGSRVHAGGEYQPDDILMIDGTEVTYEIAQSLGLIKGSDFVSPKDAFARDAENFETTTPEDTRPEAAQLLEAQIEVAAGDKAPAVMDTFANDIVANGSISEEGLQYAQEHLGMSPQSVASIYEDMQDAGGQVLSDFLETGDGLGVDRINFLVDLSEHGTREQKAIVRNVWIKAATGKLTREGAAEAFDHLYKPYE